MTRPDGPVYLDSNVLIYAMETDGEDGTLARRWIMQVDRRQLVGVTSELSLVEVLPHPISVGEQQLVEGYRRLFTQMPTLRVVPVSLSILFRAAEIRAELRSDTPDAIHAATAAGSGCRGFVTNDTRLKLPPGLVRYSLDDVMQFYR